MAVKASETACCTRCERKHNVPVLRTAEVRCPCGRRLFMAYFPLGEALLQYLRKLDPDRDGHKNAAIDADNVTERSELTRRRDTRNIVEAAAYDDKYQLFGTPFSGYTGKILPGSSIHGKSI